ncbi:hypothetical protein MG293_013053 [Ovis ammon polii]|uniref:Uncharacterized protein n=1 Tax=Ovis ammon polii TaxID=230172 RepID=A0AAD4U397_OVIAM|nr:hypothetical protein MG293_013053 [Ovis ammon polii]
MVPVRGAEGRVGLTLGTHEELQGEGNPQLPGALSFILVQLALCVPQGSKEQPSMNPAPPPGSRLQRDQRRNLVSKLTGSGWEGQGPRSGGEGFANRGVDCRQADWGSLFRYRRPGGELGSGASGDAEDRLAPRGFRDSDIRKATLLAVFVVSRALPARSQKREQKVAAASTRVAFRSDHSATFAGRSSARAAGPGLSGERSCSPCARAGGPGMRTVRGSPFQVARGEREAQNPRKLDDGIRERLLKGPGMKGETVGNRFRLPLSGARARARAR